MTPYGFEIKDAKAVVVPSEAAKLRILFTRFIDGSSLKDCAAEAQIDRTVQTCKRMLSNPVYLGTDFYPQIIDTELFQKAQKELERRTEGRKPTVKTMRIVAAPVYTEFHISPETQSGVSAEYDPQTYAAYMYGRIQPQNRIQPHNREENNLCQ